MSGNDLSTSHLRVSLKNDVRQLTQISIIIFCQQNISITITQCN